MVQKIHRPAWFATMALIAATMTGLPAAAQDDGVPNAITAGRVPADDLNENFRYLAGRISELEARLQELTTRQPEIREDIDFDVANRAQSDGLVIAYFTAKLEPGGSTWATINGYVDEEVELTTVDPKVLRATDSFATSEDLWGEQSATIVMPVFEGEYYKVELTVSDPSDEEKHIRKIYFVSF